MVFAGSKPTLSVSFKPGFKDKIVLFNTICVATTGFTNTVQLELTLLSSLLTVTIASPKFNALNIPLALTFTIEESEEDQCKVIPGTLSGKVVALSVSEAPSDNSSLLLDNVMDCNVIADSLDSFVQANKTHNMDKINNVLFIDFDKCLLAAICRQMY